MLKKYNDLKTLSKKYNIPVFDIIFIALNRYGLIMDTDEKRVRMNVKLKDMDEEYYLALAVNTFESPFKVENNKIFFDGRIVGTIKKIERDTCDTTYFRKNGTEMTLNSNARSKCKGCKFCGSYSLTAEDQFHLTEEDIVENYVKSLLKKNNLKDLSHIEGITVCTGCFLNEEKLIEHLKLLRKTLKKYKFNKRLKYIGSQIRSENSLKEIKKELMPFSLFITTEVFSNREKIMRDEKASLDINKTCELLKSANQLGIETTILYISGLESIEIFEENMKKISKFANKFPIVQVFQNYEKEHEKYRTPSAKNIEYYLEIRKKLEEIFDEKLSPNSWENYRSLFYTTYQNKEYKSIRI